MAGADLIYLENIHLILQMLQKNVNKPKNQWQSLLSLTN